MNIKYHGIEPFTLLDYPGELACILFTNGCNYRCPYCYNASLVNGTAPPPLDDESVTGFLKSRKGKLKAVVFSGGECTLQGDKLEKDIDFVRSLGYKVKVDTNGSNPELIERLIKNNKLDYVALDIKCPPGDKKKFFFTYDGLYDKMLDTLRILMESNIEYEVRTTVHPDIIDENDINDIIFMLEKRKYQGKYFIQFFFAAPETIGNVDPNPRRFKTELVKPYDGLTIGYRNKADNDKRT